MGNRKWFQMVAGSVRGVGRTDGNGRRPEGRPPPEYSTSLVVLDDPESSQLPIRTSVRNVLMLFPVPRFCGGCPSGPAACGRGESLDSLLRRCPRAGGCQPPPRRSPKGPAETQRHDMALCTTPEARFGLPRSGARRTRSRLPCRTTLARVLPTPGASPQSACRLFEPVESRLSTVPARHPTCRPIDRPRRLRATSNWCAP